MNNLSAADPGELWRWIRDCWCMRIFTFDLCRRCFPRYQIRPLYNMFGVVRLEKMLYADVCWSSRLTLLEPKPYNQPSPFGPKDAWNSSRVAKKQPQFVTNTKGFQQHKRIPKQDLMVPKSMQILSLEGSTTHQPSEILKQLCLWWWFVRQRWPCCRWRTQALDRPCFNRSADSRKHIVTKNSMLLPTSPPADQPGTFQTRVVAHFA